MAVNHLVEIRPFVAFRPSLSSPSLMATALTQIAARKPAWLKVPAPGGPNYLALKHLMRELKLHTVCEEAHCPNVGECWEHKAATFMIVVDAKPDILNHNLETIERLYRLARPGGRYARALELLRRAKQLDPGALTKSGIICGLGEEWDELLTAMRDVRAQGVDILTLGQYLRPSDQHLPIARYYTPPEFAELRRLGMAMGYRHVEAGPLVRSSYHAWEQVEHATAAV